MIFRLIWVGKTRNAPLRYLTEDYLGRLKRFARCEIVELRESSQRVARLGSAEESKRIIGALRQEACNILLDVTGQAWSSHELAAQVGQWQNESVREVAFIIGGADGVTDEVAARATARWSLSRLTLTHEMARVVLLEQLYRAYTILHGLPYQK